jgi:hypothetical protein
VHNAHRRTVGFLYGTALYLAYAVGGLPQKEIGAAFGVGRYAVSKAAVRMRRAVARNSRLRRLLVQKARPTLASQSPQ